MVKKWEDRNDFIFLFFVWLEVKKWNDKKMSLYKFTHTPLLKNDSQLIQKSEKQLKKKNHPIY